MRAFTAVMMALVLAGPAWAQKKGVGERGFERLSALLGYWEAKDPEGKTVQIWYKLIAGGSVLHETFKFADHPEMVTMYHRDGKDLLATHYCSANNQPRMRAVETKDESELKFEFHDITNLAAIEAAHMRGLRFQFEEKDRFVQSWTYREKGKDETLPLKFERKSPVPAPPLAGPQPRSGGDQ